MSRAKTAPRRRAVPVGPPASPAKRQAPGTPLAIGLLVVAHLVFFRSVLFEGRSFVSPDTIQAAAPAQRYAAAYRAEHHRDPRWIPHVFSGMPARGSMMIPVEYPVHTVLRIIGGPLYTADSAKVLHHALGSVWTFLLCRALGVPIMGAFLGGVGYSLATGLVSVTAADHGGKLYTASYIPLLLLLAFVIVHRRGLTIIAATGLAVGLMLRAKHPQIAYYGLMGYGGVILWHVPGLLRGQGVASILRVLAGVLTALAIGYLIAAPLTLPAQEYAPHSLRGAGPDGGLDYGYATQWSFHPTEAITLIIPGFFGFGGSTYWGHMPFTDAPNYGGVVIAALALVAAIACFRRTTVRLLIAMMAVALLVSMGKDFPLLFNLLFNHLPQFNRFRVPVLILVLFQMGLSVLAGMGVGVLSAAGVRGFRRWGWTFVGIALAVLLVGRAGSGSAAGAVRPGEERLTPAARDALGIERSVLARNDAVRSMLFLLVPGGMLLLIGYRPGGWRTSSTAVAVVVLSGVLDLCSVSARVVHPRYSAADLERSLEPTDAERWLSEQPEIFRVLPLGDRASSNRLMAFDVRSVMGYYPAKIARYAALLDAGGIQTLPTLRMLGTRYILSPGRLESELLVPVRSFGSEQVYAIPAAMPHAWFVPHWTVVSGDQAIRVLLQPSFLPESLAVLDKDPGIPPGGLARVDAIRQEVPERVEVEVSVERDALLLISEVFYGPGWKARVDGKPTSVHVADQTLCALVVPQGSRKVELSYDSTAERRGAQFAVAGWGMLGCLLLAACLRKEIPVAALFRRFGARQHRTQP